MMKRRKVVEKMTKEIQKSEVAPKIWAEKGESVCSRKDMGRAVRACECTKKGGYRRRRHFLESTKGETSKGGSRVSRIKARDKIGLGSFITNTPQSATRRSAVRLKRWVKR